MGYKAKPRWTANQIQFMLDNYRTMKDEELAYIFGRTLKSVRNKRQRLDYDKTSSGKGTFGLPEEKGERVYKEGVENEE